MVSNTDSSFDDAIRFALDNFSNEIIEWPIKLVNYVEQLRMYQALPFAIEVFAQFAEVREDEFVKAKLSKLAEMMAKLQAISSEEITEAMYEVWGSSSFRKATSRLFTALEMQKEGKHREYQVAVARGLFTLIWDEQMIPRKDDFDFVIDCFKKEYQQ